MELAKNAYETIEKAIRHIRAEVRKNGITINKVLQSSTTEISKSGKYSVNQFSYRFLGTKEGITSIYECSCELKGKFEYYKTPLRDRIGFDDIDYGYYGPVGEMNYYAIGDTVSINNLTSSIEDMRYDRILCVKNMELVYQPDDGYDNRLTYLELSWDRSKEDWKLVSDDIYHMVQNGNRLYLLLQDSIPEEDHKETPYIEVSATPKDIKRIKDKINSDRILTKFYEYHEVYKDNNLLLYSLGDENCYYVVLDHNIIYDSKLYANIADLLFIRNSYFIELSGEIAYIERVWYDRREEYYIDNKEHFSRDYKDVSVNCYGSKLGCMHDSERGLYIITYKDGKTEFFLLDDVKQTGQQEDKGKSQKRMIYIGKKQQINND